MGGKTKTKYKYALAGYDFHSNEWWDYPGKYATEQAAETAGLNKIERRKENHSFGEGDEVAIIHEGSFLRTIYPRDSTDIVIDVVARPIVSKSEMPSSDSHAAKGVKR